MIRIVVPLAEQDELARDQPRHQRVLRDERFGLHVPDAPHQGMRLLDRAFPLDLRALGAPGDETYEDDGERNTSAARQVHRGSEPSEPSGVVTVRPASMMSVCPVTQRASSLAR